MIVVAERCRTSEACEAIVVFVFLLLFAILERLNDGERVMLLKKAVLASYL
jgi:hypothetical protein